MKKVLLSMTMMAALFLTSCGEDASGDASGEATSEASAGVETEAPATGSIVGSWQCTGMDMGMEIPAENKAMYDEMIAATVYTFNADGSMSVASGMSEKAQTGTYKMNGNILEGTMEGKTENLTVESLTADALVLSMTDGGTSMKMSFKKN